ncbi:MAG: MotA/TolQ/ExbB proton channel family protein [Opitutales bacterium]
MIKTKRTIGMAVSVMFQMALYAQEEPIPGMELVRVNWGEEMAEGGFTMLFLGLLSVAMLTFVIERSIHLKKKKFIPEGLPKQVFDLSVEGDYDKILDVCAKKPSTFAGIVTYLIDHHKVDPQLLSQNVGDLAARDIIDQEQRTVPLAVIASLAPLLGLLGTMIGMIEAFKLVEVFGDEGGASMLAGSISKALITTAVGLILAIPSIAAYHYFKHRLHMISREIEIETEKLISAWFLRKS